MNCDDVTLPVCYVIVKACCHGNLVQVNPSDKNRLGTSKRCPGNLKFGTRPMAVALINKSSHKTGSPAIGIAFNDSFIKRTFSEFICLVILLTHCMIVT